MPSLDSRYSELLYKLQASGKGGIISSDLRTFSLGRKMHVSFDRSYNQNIHEGGLKYTTWLCAITYLNNIIKN